MLLLFITSSLAVPTDLATQGRLLDAQGDPINETLDLTFRLWSTQTGGTTPLSTHLVSQVPLADGYYSVTLEGVDTTHLAGDTWLGITLPGGDEMSLRQPLTSAPSAASLVPGAQAGGEFVLASISGETCTSTGALGFEPTEKVVRVCVDGQWTSLSNGASGPTGTQSSPGVSCNQLHTDRPELVSGAYWVDADGSGNPEEVYCDMSDDEGGWTVVGRGTDTNGAASDYEFAAAVGGDNSIIGRDADFGAVDGPQMLRGIDDLLEPGQTTVDVQWACYDTRSPVATRFWVSAYDVPVSTLITNLSAANPDFSLTGMSIRNADGVVSSSGILNVFARGNPGGTVSCGNGHAGQSGIKFTCATNGQAARDPGIVWMLTHWSGGYTEVNSCGSVGGLALPFYAGEVRIR